MKSILGNRHLMAESPEGVAIQTYSALIAALMLQLLTGKRPTKRAMELIRLYMMGYAELEEIVPLLVPEKSGNKRSGEIAARALSRANRARMARPQPQSRPRSPRERTASLKIRRFSDPDSKAADTMPNTSGTDPIY